MVDVVDKATRSRMMSGIRSSNTLPEILTRKMLHKRGYRFRLNSKIGKIKPDVVLRKFNVAIFVHGCYWHQHKGCRLAYSDRNYSEKWKKKFADNIHRDDLVCKELECRGWRVAILWECVTRDSDVFEGEIDRLDTWIRSENCTRYESLYKKSIESKLDNEVTVNLIDK